ncbi:hypothetical protein I6A60_29185 [Frankia sp. AgB1.9]|nr:hypothetical protein [Frankia sp. AgW1.1]MBL7551903.1 hypothetical protein [Frankia sp. AgB1.9]MBL7624044.1 hypothetical protein [Frankia sp. AgB1.8]
MTNPRGATTIPGRPAPVGPDGAQVITLPVPTRRRPGRAAAPAAPVQSPLARAAAAEHPVAGVRPARDRTRHGSQAAPALRLTARGRVVAAFVMGLALWGAASGVWLGVTWLLATTGH